MSANISIDFITHTFKGDLIVELTSPEGTTVRLHNQTGSSANDIITWYDLETDPDGPGAMTDFAGEWAEGQWELYVSDNASIDTVSNPKRRSCPCNTTLSI